MDYIWREANAMISWLIRIVFSSNLMSDLGSLDSRACLIEISWVNGAGIYVIIWC